MRTANANRNAAQTVARKAYQANPDKNLDLRFKMRGRFDLLQIPGIYLFGREDVSAPIGVAELQEDALPNVQFFYPDQFGHEGHNDAPEMFGSLAVEFFRHGKVPNELAVALNVSHRRAVNEKIVGDPIF